VVDKFVLELEAQLSDKHVTVELDQAARQWLAKHGHDTAMGARPMARLIQDRIKKPLADALLFGALANGGQVSVTANADGPVFSIEPATPKVPARTESE
jgi:ATP-dependent Clp protease ATP-binding subunit ClpA